MSEASDPICALQRTPVFIFTLSLPSPPFLCGALQQKLSCSPLSFGISCDSAPWWVWLSLPQNPPAQSSGWCWSCSDPVPSPSPRSRSWEKAGGGKLLSARGRGGGCVMGQKGSKMGKIKTGMKNGWVTQPSFGGTGGRGWICAGRGSIQLALPLHQGSTGTGEGYCNDTSKSNSVTFPKILILALAKPQSSPDLSSKPDWDYTAGFFFLSIWKIIIFFSVQMEWVIFLSMFKLASLGTYSEVVMSTLQNRDNSCLDKRKERKMVVNGIKTVFKRHYSKTPQTESFLTVPFLRVSATSSSGTLNPD